MKQLFAFTVLALLAALSQAQPRANVRDLGECGDLRNNYGPFDYRVAHFNAKEIVEMAHFNHGVETLTRRATGPFGGDLSYTLRVFPNHVRALLVLERLVERERADPPPDARWTLECYYVRALTFLPDDHVVRLLYANYLIKRKRPEDALKQLDYVAETTRDNPLAQLNTGRVYLDMKEYDKALVQAHRVIEMGYDRPELKEGLKAAGRWVEPGANAPDDAASAPASPASAASAASAPQ